MESISKDAAAFESVFDNLYPNGIPYSEERKNIEDEIASEITPLMEKSVSRKKKIYKGFIKHVHMESLRYSIKPIWNEAGRNLFQHQ